MELYLQKNYDGTFTIAEEHPLDFTDYLALEENIPGTTTMVEINKLVVEKYGCKKLIIQF